MTSERVDDWPRDAVPYFDRFISTSADDSRTIDTKCDWSYKITMTSERVDDWSRDAVPYFDRIISTSADDSRTIDTKCNWSYKITMTIVRVDDWPRDAVPYFDGTGIRLSSQDFTSADGWVD